MAELMDDVVVAEILLHLPPDSSKCLVHASAVCKSWRRVLHDPVFLRRYRELHRPPQHLGFLRYRRSFYGLDDHHFTQQKNLAVVEGDRLDLPVVIEAIRTTRVVLRQIIDLTKLLPAHASSTLPRPSLGASDSAPPPTRASKPLYCRHRPGVPRHAHARHAHALAGGAPRRAALLPC
ncbi:unnamed protein product [Urochloa humidicola]